MHALAAAFEATDEAAAAFGSTFTAGDLEIVVGGVEGSMPAILGSVIQSAL